MPRTARHCRMCRNYLMSKRDKFIIIENWKKKMNTKTLLLVGCGVASIYFGASGFYNEKKVNDYFSTHPAMKQYLYLDQYDKLLTQTWQSYGTYVTKQSEGKVKEQAQKVEKDLELALVHMKQQKLLLEGDTLVGELKGLDKLVQQQQQDSMLLMVSFLGLTGVALWKWLTESESINSS